MMPHASAAWLFSLLVLAPCALPAQAATPEDGNSDAGIKKVIEDYCSAISDKAGELRVARQAAALKALQAQVEERLNELEQRKSELEDLVKKREALRNLAEKEIVDIYAGMNPEIAAIQMDKVDVKLAASVLRQLKPRQASAVLNEMKPELAAKMVKIIAAAASPQPGD